MGDGRTFNQTTALNVARLALRTAERKHQQARLAPGVLARLIEMAEQGLAWARVHEAWPEGAEATTWAATVTSKTPTMDQGATIRVMASEEGMEPQPSDGEDDATMGAALLTSRAGR